MEWVGVGSTDLNWAQRGDLALFSWAHGRDAPWKEGPPRQEGLGGKYPPGEGDYPARIPGGP